MRTSKLAWVIVVALGTGLSAPTESHAQFNPEGRQRVRPQPAPRAPARRPTRTPARPQPTPSKAPSADALIARYTGIVLAQPGAQFPLQRLAQLYRERDGNLDKLVEEFEKRAAQPGDQQWNALVALAGIYKQNGKPEESIATYERALKQRPDDPVALRAVGQALQERGDLKRAREYFEKALPKLQGADRELMLRTVMQFSLDLKDFEAAKKAHQQLVQLAKGSFFVRAELGRELMLRQDFERAADEYKDVVKAATGDNRVLAPALRDLGKALSKLKRREEALKVLRRGLGAAGGQTGIRREIYDVIVEVYRAENRLTELIRELEAQNPGDFERLRLLGELYEETGQVESALETYKKALAQNRRDIGTRLKMVQLLQLQGELDAAIKEYEALIQAAPRNPDFVFQLAEALIQRGDRERALEHLQKLEARSRGDDETLAALVDFYERVEESKRALEVLKRLSDSGSHDPQHLVELGDRYWQEDKKEQALRAWQRILTVVPDRARALYTLGEVYLEHGMAKKALEALEEAAKLKPDREQYQKAYALALERTGASASTPTARNRQYEQARRIWEGLLANAGDNAHLAREARQHIVTLWSLSGQLEQRVLPLERRLESTPPDLDAGRLLAEVQIRLRQYADAEETLNKVVAKAPGDVSSLLRLERVLVLERKLEEAIATLEKLVEAEPKRAREYYQRMAKYAAELYQDDRAVRYAAKAVELSPDDASGHQKLGEMYRQRQQPEKAIAAFRQAIIKNDRLFPVYFQLAELLIGQGKLDEADRLLRRVVRSSPDEELVARAARLSMQINLGKGTLVSLERELLPVALGNPQKPIYRQLLVEMYGAMAFPLVHQARAKDPEVRQKARTELRQLGERAVKPLLDALNDERDAQQRIAIEILVHIENPGAGPALFAYATGPADAELRARAMVAVGMLSDADLLPKLQEYLAPRGVPRSDESDPVSLAAAWAVARMRSANARPLLHTLLDSEAPNIKALAALGLGFLEDRRSKERLVKMAGSMDTGPLARAAAAHALGALGASTDVDALVQLARSENAYVRGAAILALARLKVPAARASIAEALVSADSDLRRTATIAAQVYTAGNYRIKEAALAPPDGRIQVDQLLADLVPEAYAAPVRARALAELEDPIAQAAVAAIQSSPEGARAVAEALLARDGKPAFGALTSNLDETPLDMRKAAFDAAESIAARTVDPMRALAGHPDPSTRSLVVRFLATRPEPRAQAAVIEALEDPDPSVQRAALEAAGKAKSARAPAAMVRLLEPDYDWSLRVRAADALGKLGDAPPEVYTALEKSARDDRYALVREAALRALAGLSKERARPVLLHAQSSDREPKVRDLAKRLLGE